MVKKYLRKGYWHDVLLKAYKIRQVHLCPFQLFAEKHGYDLRYDELIFPRSAPEFDEEENKYCGIPYSGFSMWFSGMYELPKNVRIDYVSTTTETFADRIMLVKFCQHRVDGLLLDWELIIKPWPINSYCTFSLKTVPGKTIIGKPSVGGV